ncbi:MAG: MoaD/ThiS family protein [Jatrophihabitans sp.]|uniref:MoaD/ThiS family protein n=1 Tax=Jatrophihabitans sp. TaxID=1932789 RepID=UPI003F7FC1E2
MSAKVTVRYWAGARRAAGVEEDTAEAATISELKSVLAQRGELAKVVEVASFLVDSDPSSDSTRLYDGAVVDVLPPFAGG